MPVTLRGTGSIYLISDQGVITRWPQPKRDHMTEAQTIERIVTRSIPIVDGKFPAIRDDHMTASVVGALFDEHDYTTEWQLWQTHATRKSLTPFKAPEPGLPAKIGLALEQSIAELLQSEKGMLLEPVRQYIYAPSLRIGATLDFWCYRDDEGNEFADPVPLDAKAINHHAWQSRWQGGKVIPTEYLLQVNTQCGLTAMPVGYLGCLVGGASLEVFRVPFSAALWERTIGFTNAFFKSIADGKEPAINPKRDTAAVFGFYRQSIEAKAIDLSDNNMACELERRWSAEDVLYKAAKDVAETHEGNRKEIAAQLLHLIRDAQFARVGSRMIVANTINRSAYSVKPSTYRTLTIKDQDNGSAGKKGSGSTGKGKRSGKGSAKA